MGWVLPVILAASCLFQPILLIMALASSAMACSSGEKISSFGTVSSAIDAEGATAAVVVFCSPAWMALEVCFSGVSALVLTLSFPNNFTTSSSKLSAFCSNAWLGTFLLVKLSVCSRLSFSTNGGSFLSSLERIRAITRSYCSKRNFSLGLSSGSSLLQKTSL